MNRTIDFAREATERADSMMDGEINMTPDAINIIVSMVSKIFGNIDGEERELLLLLCGLALKYSIMKKQSNELREIVKDFTGMMEAKRAREEGKIQ